MPKSSDKNRRAGQGSKSRSGFLDFEERIKQRAEKEKERTAQLEYQDKVLADHEKKEKRLLEIEEKRLQNLERRVKKMDEVQDLDKSINEFLTKQTGSLGNIFGWERKRVQNIIDINDGLKKSNKYSKESRDIARDVTDVSTMILDKTTSLEDLEEKLVELKVKGLKTDTSISQGLVKQEIRHKKIAQVMGAIDEAAGGVGAKIKEWGVMLMKNPILLAVTAIIGALMVTKDLMEQNAAQTDMIGQNFGHMAHTNRDLVNYARDMNAEYADLDINLEKVNSSIGGIADSLGFSAKRSLELAYEFERIGMGAGLTNDNVQSLYTNMVDIAGISEDTLEHFILQGSALADQADVAPQAVMRDIAESSEFMASYTKDGGKNILQAAINAKKFGVQLSTVANISDSLLNVQDSIAGQFEASLMIGKQLNYNSARRLALEGKTDEAVRDIVSQLGGQSEFNKLDVLQRRSLASSLGIQVDELAKIMNRQDRITELTTITKENVEATQYPEEPAKKAIAGYTRLANTTKNWKDIAIASNKEAFDSMDKMAGDAADELKKVMKSAWESFKNNALAAIALVASSLLALRILASSINIGGVGGMGGRGMRGMRNPGKMYQTKSGRWKTKGMKGPGFKDPNKLLNKTQGAGKNLTRGGKFLRGTKSFMRGNAAMAGIGLALDAFSNYSDPNQSFMQATGNTLNSNKFLLLGAGLGSIIPGVGTAVGAGIGGIMDFFFSDGILGGKGIIAHQGKVGTVAANDSIMAFNEERYMKSLSKKAGIYGFAGQTSRGMDFDYNKFGETMFKVMNNVEWEQRTNFSEVVKSARATSW